MIEPGIFILLSVLLVAFTSSRPRPASFPWIVNTVGAPKEDIENTSRLVSVGAYRYMRHPLYCTLLLGGVGGDSQRTFRWRRSRRSPGAECRFVAAACVKLAFG